MKFQKSSKNSDNMIQGPSEKFRFYGPNVKNAIFEIFRCIFGNYGIIYKPIQNILQEKIVVSFNIFKNKDFIKD